MSGACVLDASAALSVHDATYLETALRLNAALASRDKELLRASLEADVTTFDLR